MALIATAAATVGRAAGAAQHPAALARLPSARRAALATLLIRFDAAQIAALIARVADLGPALREALAQPAHRLDYSPMPRAAGPALSNPPLP